jgi:predicted nucleotidyltransferase
MGNSRYWKINSLGELENDSAKELISPEFDPVLKEVVEIYRATLGDALESVYLTGSVSRGVHRAEQSDIDFFAIL